MLVTLLIAAGGALGSVGRYWVGVWMAPLSHALPIGTITINIVGSFVMAFFCALTVMGSRFAVPEIWRLAFIVGVCGGFTTFSSFSVQTVDLLRMGETGKALLNVGISMIACFSATALGYWLAEKISHIYQAT